MINPENPWITHQVRSVYDNPWLRVEDHDITNPAGRPGQYGVIRYKNRAVGIVPIDESGCTWLVGQYRYPLGEYSWEIPAGGCPAEESPLETAQRELAEETGLTAKNYRVLLDEVALSNSVSDERATLFVATDLTPGLSSPEETEALRLRRLPLHEAIEMVLRGEITDSLSVMALLRLALDA